MLGLECAVILSTLREIASFFIVKLCLVHKEDKEIYIKDAYFLK